MDGNRYSKMTRQLMIYSSICHTYYHGPDELMKQFHINRRMLQRDLKDLRDAGIIRLKLNKADNNYIEADEPAVFDESSTGRRRQHLIRLNRLATLIDELPRTDMDELNQYESEHEEYAYYQEYMMEDPEEFLPEDLGDPPTMPDFEDIKAAYYSLFPDSSERMRQRDFAALNDAGYNIYYSQKYKAFIFDEGLDE